jgi:uncharacterized protein
MLWDPWGEAADPQRLAALAADFDGVLAAASLTRLAAVVQSLPGDIRVALRFDHDDGHRPQLAMTARAEALVLCQRCGEPLACSLESHAQFVFAHSADDEMALAQAGRDVYGVKRPVMLAAMVEDELILSLPMAPVHVGECRPVTLSMVPHPFAMLAGLLARDHLKKPRIP